MGETIDQLRSDNRATDDGVRNDYRFARNQRSA